MIKSLSPQIRTKYSKLVDYAHYLAQGIRADNLVFVTESFNPTDVVLDYSKSSTNVISLGTNKKNILDYLSSNSIESSIFVVEEREGLIELFKPYLDRIPFVIFFTTSNNSLLGNINTQFKSSIEGINFILMGKLADIKSVEKKKVIAAVSTFNDEDIIEQTIEYLIKQEVDVLAIDNWSTDSTWEILNVLRSKYPNRIYTKQYPEIPDKTFDWKSILRFKANNPIVKNYDWIIHYDSDEIRMSPWVKNNLCESISFVDSLGFNAIDFTVINFMATEDGFDSTKELEGFFKYFEFGNKAAYFLQIKAWKNFGQEVDLEFAFGHEAIFSERKVFPLKFQLKYYPLRSNKQARKKIFQDRAPRYSQKEKGAHNHYDGINSETNFIKDSNDLLEYGSDEKFINKYLIESTSGIGLKLKSNAAVILGFVRPKNEDLLIEAIKRLKEQTHREFDIFVYDNSEIENSLEKTRSLFPDVYIKKNAKNCGFAGGNNSVMREVLKTNNYDYIVLLNDDTQVSSDWLKSLIEMAEENQEYGAVTSKLIFYEPFVRLQFSTQTFNPKKDGISEDTRDLGIKLYTGETRFEHTHYSKKFLREGLYGLEGEFSWSSKEFFLDIPVGYNYPEETYTLLLSLEGASQINNQTLEVAIGSFNTKLDIAPEKKVYTVEVPKTIIEENKFNLIQNAGSGITAQFNGYDIGSLNGNAEIDKGQYDEPREVEMICGGAVLFKADVLRKVGLFDEYYFVYYEDSDLSLRIRKAGYKLMYQPKALVRHIHAGSSTEYSPFFTYHVWKNKPVFVIKNFSIRPILFAFKELTKIQLEELKNAAKHKFRNGYHNSRLKVILKSSIKFYSNLPLVLLKKFNIVKSV